MLALSRPSAASFACCTRSAINDVSSRKITTPPLRLLTERREVRQDIARAVGRAERVGALAAELRAPGRELFRERRRDAVQRLVGASRAAAEVLGRRVVDEPNPILAVDYDDALAQMLNDVFVELDDVAQVEAALLGERFGLDDPRVATAARRP